VTDPSNGDSLLRKGWTRQFTASEPRLSEAVAAYEEAGFEVRLEPLPPASSGGSRAGEREAGDECRICFEGFEDRYRVIYTRPRSPAFSPSNRDDGLFD